jgi:ribosome biogenesis protein NSA2
MCLHLQVDRAKVLSNTIKQKRKEKAGKWEVPLPKARVPTAVHVSVPSRRQMIDDKLFSICDKPNIVMQVRPIAEDEMFKVMRSGKRQKKQWKRMLTKVTFVGGGFTRKPPKYERFIRPTGVFRQKSPSTASEWPCYSIATSVRRCCLTSWTLLATYACYAAGLRMNKAHVTHPELKCTFCLGIIGVKKNPNGQTYTSLGVMTKGTIIEVYPSR